MTGIFLRMAGKYAMARAREASTWRNLILLIGGIWAVENPHLVEAIVPVCIALAGLIGSFFPDIVGNQNQQKSLPVDVEPEINQVIEPVVEESPRAKSTESTVVKNIQKVNNRRINTSVDDYEPSRLPEYDQSLSTPSQDKSTDNHRSDEFSSNFGFNDR